MELPLGNFFQVSINSSKLFSFIQEISKRITETDNKINDISHAMQKILFNLDCRFKDSQDKILIEVQKVKRSSQEEVNYLKLYMKDMDKKIEQKIDDLQNVGVMLSTKITNVKQNIQETTFSQLSILQNKVNNLQIMKQLQSHSNKSLQTLIQKVLNLQQNYQKLNEEMGENMRNNQDIMEKLNMERHKSAQLFMSMENTLKNQKFQKHKIRGQCESQDNIQEFKLMEQRVASAEKRIDEKFKKIGHGLRRSKISNNNISKLNDNKSNFHKKSSKKIRQIQNNIFSKLTNIQQTMLQRFQQLQNNQIRSTNKNTIIDEHIAILTRKIQKQKVKINQTISTLKNIGDKKIDDKVIENLKIMIKKISKDLQQNLQLKVNKQQYSSDKQRFNKKINEIFEIIIEKAQKNEVKKGFTFLEQKIKQVIIVLTEDKIHSNKDGAIKKTKFNCLSCDKDLQLQLEKQDKNNAFCTKNNKENAGLNIRCQTNQIRRRKMINNTAPTINFDE